MSGGGGGPTGLGGGEWVGEHQRSGRELAVGSVGREEGRRRELRGELGAAALMAAAAALVAADGSARRVEQGGEQRGREETRLRSKGRGKSQARARAGWGKGARHCSARSSPWHADGSSRRACKEMAPRGEAERLRGGAKDGARGEHGAWPAALTRRRPRLGRKQGREERTERELEV